MERRWLKLLTVVAISAGAAACSDRSAPVGPKTVPSVASTPSPQIRASGGSYYVGNWQLLVGHGNTQTKIAILDEHGGQIVVGGSSLDVPPNALSGSTLLTFTLQSQPFIQAKLYALSLEGKTRGSLVTVFPVALTLKLSYADANQQVANPSALKMAWLENSVMLGLVPSSVDRNGKKLIGSVTHFTEFGPVTGPPTDPWQN